VGSIQQEAAAYTNHTTSTQRLFAIVDQRVPNAGGAFVFEANYENEKAGETCQSAVTLNSGETVTNDLTGYGNNYGENTAPGGRFPGCSVQSGTDIVYQIEVQPQAILRATVTPSITIDLNLSLIVGTSQTCDRVDRSCTMSSTGADFGEPETICFKNESGIPVTAFMIVDRSAVVPNQGSFTMVAEISQTPCSM
jgi:hypothetical protein